MWKGSYSVKHRGIKAAQVWKVWANVDRWSEWQKDLEFAKLNGKFEEGGTFDFKPKGGPRLTLELVRVETNREFVDLTRFPLARMYGSHRFQENDGELEITTTISIEGPLAFVWRKLVAEKIVAGLKEQTDRLIERATHV